MLACGFQEMVNVYVFVHVCFIAPFAPAAVVR